MRLVHFSGTPLGAVEPREQYARPTMKPVGLWLTDEDEDESWSAFCGQTWDDRPGVGRLAFARSVTLAEDANLVRIDSPLALRGFTDEFGRDLLHLHDGYGFILWVDWAAVARQWQGILITPFICGVRWEPWAFWYTSWDCASGCIWDPAAIAAVEVIETPDRARGPGYEKESAMTDLEPEVDETAEAETPAEDADDSDDE